MKILLPKILLTGLVSLFCMAVKAQVNLVPNPSFEDYSGCPMGYPDLDGKCNDWISFRFSPDYMNNCSQVCGYYNQYGYQQPKSGKAYAGFAAYHTSIPEAREHIGVQFASPLSIGTKYYVSFYVSAAFNEQMNIACNKIGALVTTYQYNDVNGSNPLPNSCTVKTDAIIKDTVGWVKVMGSFIADSTYLYLIIGNFFDDKNIDTLHFPDLAFGHYVSYYYLDDVCLSTDSLLCGVNTQSCDFALPTAFSPNGDNVNDTYKWISNCTSFDSFTMRIYNRWGEIVFNTRDSNYAWDGTHRGEKQPSDVYAVHISVIVDGKPISKISNLTLFR